MMRDETRGLGVSYQRCTLPPVGNCTLPRRSLYIVCHIVPRKASVLLAACFLWLCTGNDDPYRMDYRGCCHPLPILYTLNREGIRCYFPHNIIRPVHIGIDVPPVRCPV